MRADENGPDTLSSTILTEIVATDDLGPVGVVGVRFIAQLAFIGEILFGQEQRSLASSTVAHVSSRKRRICRLPMPTPVRSVGVPQSVRYYEKRHGVSGPLHSTSSIKEVLLFS